MEHHQKQGLRGFSPIQSAACGAGVSTGPPSMRLSITSTTGSPVELTVPRGETVEGLRTRISQKLKLQTDRIVLLHKDRHLTAGKLLEQSVTDGSKLTLLPVIEAGLVCSTARAEKTTMDVLESLTDDQINDFLSGRLPLTISLRIGTHIMYVQLQLSAQDVKKLQQDRDSRTQSSSRLQTGPQTPGSISQPGSASAWSSTNTTGSANSPASQTTSAAVDSPDSTALMQLSTQRPRTSFNSGGPTSYSSSRVPAVNCRNPSSLLHSQASSRVLSNPSLPSSCPHPSCPRQATTPVCLTGPTGSSPGPPSPAPATTFTESNVNGSSPAEQSKQPGAVIESFVSHSSGVFSGTFSGTLAPCSQSSIAHPRRGIAIILQILNDLLKAAYNHQRAPTALSLHHHPASNISDSPPLTAEKSQNKTSSRPPPMTLRTEQIDDESHLLHSATEENQTMHCKLEHLQHLMHQRRLRRRTRRNVSQTPRPYHHHHHHRP